MRILLDQEKCIASGNCVLECPEVFGQDDDGIVMLLQPSLPEELYDSVRAAERACPAAVISTEVD
jgi:ferredoxin